MGATDTIANWIVNTTYEAIQPEAIRVANESCFDVIGVILAGSAQPAGEIIKKYVADQGAAPQATVLSTGEQSSVANAAFANGTMGHALDFDDFGGFGHPTVAIFPALLAIGEHSGATGRDLLEAYVVGCDVGLALQHATKYKQMDKGFRGTAACAKLMKLDHDQTVMTCRDGVTATQLAQMGFTAGEHVIEHPFGFVATVLGEGIYDLDEMADNLGKPYRIQDASMIKKYPCCDGNHAMLDSLMRDNDFTYGDVTDAEVVQSYYSVVMLYQNPDDELKGKFSAKYNVAAALVDGEVAVNTFTHDKIADPTIDETMDKVRTRVMAKSEETLTRSEDGHTVKITLKDGRVFEHATARAYILGSQKNPWGFENIKSKFQANVAFVLSEQGVEDAVNAWSDQMQGSTPCSEWNVQALITQNIQVAAFVESLLQENITVNPLDVSGGIPGDDPLKALDANVVKVMDIIKASGSADTQINTPFGEMTRGQFMMTPTWDLVVHKWDLAKGTRQNTALDDSFVEAVYNTFAPMANGMRHMEMASQHIVGPEVTVSAGASLQARLLGAFGRQP